MVPRFSLVYLGDNDVKIVPPLSMSKEKTSKFHQIPSKIPTPKNFPPPRKKKQKNIVFFVFFRPASKDSVSSFESSGVAAVSTSAASSACRARACPNDHPHYIVDLITLA